MEIPLSKNADFIDSAKNIFWDDSTGPVENIMSLAVTGLFVLSGGVLPWIAFIADIMGIGPEALGRKIDETLHLKTVDDLFALDEKQAANLVTKSLMSEYVKAANVEIPLSVFAAGEELNLPFRQVPAPVHLPPLAEPRSNKINPEVNKRKLRSRKTRIIAEEKKLQKVQEQIERKLQKVEEQTEGKLQKVQEQTEGKLQKVQEQTERKTTRPVEERNSINKGDESKARKKTRKQKKRQKANRKVRNKEMALREKEMLLREKEVGARLREGKGLLGLLGKFGIGKIVAGFVALFAFLKKDVIKDMLKGNKAGKVFRGGIAGISHMNKNQMQSKMDEFSGQSTASYEMSKRMGDYFRNVIKQHGGG